MNMYMDMTMDMGTFTDSATETDMDMNTDMYVEMFKDKDIGDGHGHCAWTRTFRCAKYCQKNQKAYVTYTLRVEQFSAPGIMEQSDSPCHHSLLGVNR